MIAAETAMIRRQPCRSRTRQFRMTNPTIRPLESRLNNIDAIRLILAILVLFSHSFPAATNSEESEPLSWLTRDQTNFGGLAVDWFFVLSGFLITQSWERSQSAFRFLLKRVARIYPGFLMASAIGLWVVVPLVAQSNGWQVFSFGTLKTNIPRLLLLRRSEGLPEIFPHNPIPVTLNASLWTISYEFWCYLGVMLLGSLTLLKHRWLMLAFFLGTVLLGYYVAYNDLIILYKTSAGWRPFELVFGQPRFWTRLAPMYLAGVVTYLFREYLQPSRWWALGSIGVLAVGIFIPSGLTLVAPVFGTYLLFYLCFTQDIRWHNVAKYGDFSYGIYLYAFPIQQLVMMRFGQSIGPYQLFGLAFVPTVIAGILSWYLVERRFLRMSHSVRRQSPVSPIAKVS